MDSKKRNEIISKAIDECVEDLGHDFWACGISFSSDVF